MEARIFLRPIALPLPIGYSGLAVGGGLVGAFHLSLLPVAQQHSVGLLVVLVVPALLLLTSVFSLLGRDTAAATETGVLAFGWLGTGIGMLHDPAGHTSATLGVFAATIGAGLIPPLVATTTSRMLPALVIGAAFAHQIALAVLGLAPSTASERAVGVLGWILAAVAIAVSIVFQLTHNAGDGDVEQAPGVRGHF